MSAIATPASGAIMIPAIAADGTRFPIEKLDAHRRGLLHDAVSVFVFCGDALLIQRRAATKYHCGGLWANTCCSHPNWGERADACATRRLREELGVELPLRPAGMLEYAADVGCGLVEHERVQVFRGDADRTRLALAPAPAEVSETRWAELDALRREATAVPERFAPWLRIYLTRWRELGLDALAAV